MAARVSIRAGGVADSFLTLASDTSMYGEKDEQMLHIRPDTLSLAARRTRREVLIGTSAGAIGLGLLPRSRGGAAAHEVTDQNGDALAHVALPPDVGQASRQVYVEATGHTLRGSMLDYWRANGAAAVYGNPISEPFAASNGYYSQAFENIVLQYRPEFLYTHDPIMRPLPIGKVALANRLATSAASRASSRALRQAAEALGATDARVERVIREGGIFSDATGHTVSGELLTWYTFQEGAFYLGDPLTEPVEDRERTVQYFEGGLLMVGDDGVSLAPLAKDLAPQLEIDTTPVAQGELPLYDELLFWIVDNPNPLGDPYAPGPKWIEVSTSQQTLWAYHGDTPIHQSLVSTGLAPNLTELGMFHIRLKYPEQDLGGFTDATGEVIGFGEAPPGTTPYLVEDVPHVMYFNMDAEALHGTYWHNSFGQPMSHGCVNLTLDVAEWLYGWAPLGTGVWIHD